MPEISGSPDRGIEKINPSFKIDEFEAKKTALDALVAQYRAKSLEESKYLLSQSQIKSAQKNAANAKEEVSQEKGNQHTEVSGTKTPSLVQNQTRDKGKLFAEQSHVKKVKEELQELKLLIERAKTDLEDYRIHVFNNPELFSNNLYFLTFYTKETRDVMLEKYALPDTLWNRMISFGRKRHIPNGPNDKISFSMKEAPEPTDILWKNLSATKCEKYTTRLMTFFLTFVLIGIGFGIVLGLKILQRNMSKNLKSTDSTFDRSTIQFRALSVGITFVIFCVNTILPMLMRRLTQYEKQVSNTDFYKSLTFKIAFVKPINPGSVHQHQYRGSHHPRHRHVSRCSRLGQRRHLERRLVHSALPSHRQPSSEYFEPLVLTVLLQKEVSVERDRLIKLYTDSK